jgi:2-succinyl-5-enolpyruvyl-6-hydroxy-3-cyclohexene-1-carboxylate synthase
VSEADRSFEAAWWIVDAFVGWGMRDACISPGSRSTPIALALWRHPSVRAWVHLDERASAFFALGIAKATGAPVGVACTSGTAVAELMPAVVEASMSRATLIVMTADRPPELRDVGANQTIEQPGIFGPYVRASIDAPVPADDIGREAWHEILRSAIAAAVGPPPGPVHLNLPFREPLVPGPASLSATEWTDVQHSISEDAAPDALRELVETLSSTRRGVVLAGSLREVPPGLGALAERVGWPLIAEPTSGWRRPGALAAGQHVIADPAFLERHTPDAVVQFGAAPTSRAGLELVRRAARLVIVDPDHLVADPLHRAAVTVHADLAALVPDLLELVTAVPESSWLRGWRAADVAARAAVDAELDRDDEPFEGRVARDVSTAAPAGSVLVVGSSMPVRDLDAYMAPRGDVGVIANRGASGIDGFVSAALGVAASSGRPTTALCGDLTFLYDAGALIWNASRGFDLVIVVVNNDGGGIFALLSQRELPELDDLFVTPHGVDLGAVCAAARAGHTRVTSASALVPAIVAARAAGGVHVVEVIVDRETTVDRRERVRAAVSAAISHV